MPTVVLSDGKTKSFPYHMEGIARAKQYAKNTGGKLIFSKDEKTRKVGHASRIEMNPKASKIANQKQILKKAMKHKGKAEALSGTFKNEQPRSPEERLY
tara:strand:+ start:158 stop:454 length:297 start_codon:yes stop_codon:yes gene_type:complete